MHFYFPWFTLIYLAGAILTSTLAIIIRRRSFAPGYVPFTYLLLTMSLWTITSALATGAVEIPDKIFFTKVEYIALVCAGPLSLIYMLEYTHIRIPNRMLVLLWIIPIASLIVVWSNELHSLIWTNIFLPDEMDSSLSIWEDVAL